MNRHHQQRGVALITALLIVSIAVVLAASLVDHMFLDIRRTDNLLQADYVYSVATATEEKLRLAMLLDAQDNEYDDFFQLDGASSQLTVPLAKNQLFVVNLLDMQSRFNLNNLQPGGQQAVYREQFQALLTSRGLDPNLVYAVEDWVDSNDVVENPAYGAEFDYYIGLQPPYRAANRRFASPSELKLIKGFEKDEIYDAIIPYLSALPEITAINVNTASLEVLESLPGMTPTAAQEAIRLRADKSFETIADFENQMRSLNNNSGFKAQGASVGTDYVLMRSEVAYLNDTSGPGFRFYSLLHRNAKGQSNVISRSQGVW
jgi:general secretion pathway protein K